MNKLILILVAAVALDIAPLPAQDTPDLFRQAAEQGNADAQFNLGVMYANGRGVLKDATLAHMWLNIAGANGSEIAREWRDTISDSVSPAERALACHSARSATLARIFAHTSRPAPTNCPDRTPPGIWRWGRCGISSTPW